MDFSTAVQACFSRYATFSGRAPRAEYWWWTLFVIIANAVLTAVDTMLGFDSLLSGLFALATLLPSLAVGARRLHDLGKSGWWLLIGLIPLVGVIILIIWFIRPGEPGQNAYGPNPYGH